MKRAIVILGLVAILGGGIFAYVNWSNRYRWPRKPVPSLEDLPALDRSNWPKTPVAWSNESVVVEVATPDGLKTASLTYHINSLGMKLVCILPGTFWTGRTDQQARMMGEAKGNWHPVTITKPFYLAAFEVTNRQFEQFQKHTRPKYQRGNRYDDHPVEGVSWRDAQRYCRWLSEQEGRLYRLPTEAEWEYACKAGTTTILYWGDASWDRRKANVGGIRQATESYAEDGYRFTAPVGVYPPNPWGLYDMIGNAWEWVNDWFAPIPAERRADPTGPATGKMRVDKGGGWDTRTRDISCHRRDGNNPADLFEKRGFRVLCEDE